MLSIIVPVYNVEKYLYECLDSLTKQTSKDFEVIIVNDGSTDSCQTIIDLFCENNNNFKSFYKENGGLMSAYLLGIEKTIGDYIGFVDSDDYIDKTFVEKIYINNIEKADIVICNRFDVIDNKTREKEQPLFSGFFNETNNTDVYKKILPPFSGRHITNARWNKIFKREIVLSNLKYCESKSRIMEDRFFTPSCMFSAKTFKFIDDRLYYYRHREGSNHSIASPKLYDTIKMLMNTQKQMLKDKSIFQQYQNEYELACLNYLSLYIERNMVIKQPFKTRQCYSRLVVKDKIFSFLVKKYKKELKYKKGFVIRLSYFFKSPFILSLFTAIFSK